MDVAADPSPIRLAVAVDVAVADVELVADSLFAHGASAVAEQPSGEGRCTLVADLAPDELAEFGGEPLLVTLSVGAPRVLEPELAWNEGWREFAQVWRCGDHLVLRPEWVAAEPSLVEALAAGEIDEIVIEPGAAFGSGGHVTTRLCVEQVGLLVAGGERVLDVGCGTGVLGVAALRRGATGVVALDIDPEARRVTRELADRNGVGEALTVSEDLLEDHRHDGYDLVLANLLIPIIEDLAGPLAAAVAPGGHLVASGVLESQGDRVVTALAPLELVRTATAEGWMTLVFGRPDVG